MKKNIYLIWYWGMYFTYPWHLEIFLPLNQALKHDPEVVRDLKFHHENYKSFSQGDIISLQACEWNRNLRDSIEWFTIESVQTWQGNKRHCTIMDSIRHTSTIHHDDVIKWKHFPRYWPFVRGIHRSRWIPCTKASDAGLWCCLWSAPG